MQARVVGKALLTNLALISTTVRPQMRHHGIIVQKPFLTDRALDLVKFRLLPILTESMVLIRVLGLYKIGISQASLHHTILLVA